MVFHIYWRYVVHTLPLSLELLQCVLANHQCSPEVLSTLEATAEVTPHSVRIAHASSHLDVTIALLKSLSVKVGQKRTLAGQVSLQQEQPIHCSSG